MAQSGQPPDQQGDQESQRDQQESASRRYAVCDSVVVRTVGDVTVLLELDSGTYYSLEGVAAEIWRGVESELTLAEIADRVAGEYEVEIERATGDARSFLREALDHGLLIAR